MLTGMDIYPDRAQINKKMFKTNESRKRKRGKPRKT